MVALSKQKGEEEYEKRICCVMLSAIMSFLLATSTLGSDVALSSKCDSEYEAAVAEIMLGYSDNPYMATERLSMLDTELLSEPQTTAYYSNSRGTDQLDYEINVYSFNRGGSRNVYLQCLVKAYADEIFWGDDDYISIEWDTEYASLYLANGDSTFSTVSDFNTGIVLFAVLDKNMDNGDSTFATVQVRPEKNGELEFFGKYVHTYSKNIFSAEATYTFRNAAELHSIGVLTLGLEHTFGVQINSVSNIGQWSIAGVNGTEVRKYG